MKKLPILGAFFLAFGCSDDPIRPSLEGEYELVRAEGESLPYTVDSSVAETCWWRLVDGSITVTTEDTFFLNYTEQLGCGSEAGDMAPGFFAGRVERDGSELTFVAEQVDQELVFPASFSGGVLQVTASDMNSWAPGSVSLAFEEQ